MGLGGRQPIDSRVFDEQVALYLLLTKRKAELPGSALSISILLGIFVTELGMFLEPEFHPVLKRVVP
jgi:hypothetical protein